MVVTGVVLSLLLAALLALTGSGKVLNTSSSQGIRDSLTVPPSLWRAIGLFELVLVVALILGAFLPAATVVGAIGVVVLMIGAIVTRLRALGVAQPAGLVADGVVLLVGVLAAVLRTA
ncbi:DoxX family protein [Kineosporia rhizophila]|uniref:DoxX family protein n=1 Tax=Kineosporia TaxID=49184 RepID=UPI000AD78731|nr:MULTISPECIES: DoxX family protein [Kineosporia]MCE0538594.1 DoxX family protein [Kineosporia rhizophila]GLY19617.1 hypothetical protein Kisp01_66310 [Kineosporia sp. NBRC 101677]